MSTALIEGLESRYFLWERPKKAANRKSTFRTFAQFLGYPRKKLRTAFLNFFRLDGQIGNKRLTEFHDWLLAHGRTPDRARASLCEVRPFLSYAYREGTLRWKVTHKLQLLSRKRWNMPLGPGLKP